MKKLDLVVEAVTRSGVFSGNYTVRDIDRYEQLRFLRTWNAGAIRVIQDLRRFFGKGRKIDGPPTEEEITNFVATHPAAVTLAKDLRVKWTPELVDSLLERSGRRTKTGKRKSGANAPSRWVVRMLSKRLGIAEGALKSRGVLSGRLHLRPTVSWLPKVGELLRTHLTDPALWVHTPR